LQASKRNLFISRRRSGLSDAEIEFAKKHNFIAIQLGPRILRTETAALAMIASLQSSWGDMK
jgi:16S rRNA (uracil1498-N3)-methyltransferase